MIQVYKTKKAIGFRVSGEIYQQISKWAYSIDEKVFKKQLATGRFAKNVELTPKTLALMRHVEKQGKILPYYGAGGSSGVCTYRFRVKMSRIELTVEHGVTGKTMSLDTPLKTSRRLTNTEGLRFKFCPFPYLSKEKLPPEWSGKSPKVLVCKIAGREYENLAKWLNWVDTQALSERYEYSFGEVSVGATGFVAKVRDIKSNKLIDLTDYDDW
ncbi:MAG: hypothetical protein ABIJ52_11340 [Pseudomonadota bacterium]